MNRYLRLWEIPGAPLLLVGGTVARIGHGVTIVAWLLLVRAETGSYAEAGIVAGAISLATAFAAPVAGRLVDRFAVRTVLPILALLYSGSQILLLITVLADRSTTVLLVAAVFTGLFFPPMSPAIRSGWTHLTRDGTGYEGCRTTAMAAESTVFELVFVVGPLLVSGFVLAATSLRAVDPSISGTASAIVLATATTAIGTVVVARGRALAGLTGNGSGQRTVGIGPLRVRGFPMMLIVTAAVAFSFGASPVAIAAFADIHAVGNPAAATGLLIAVWSIGSAIGGLTYGALPLSVGVDVRMPAGRATVVLAGLAVGYALWTVVDGTTSFGVVLLLTGAVIAPATAMLAEMVAAAVPASMLTEAYTWFTCVNMSVAALGAAVTGRVVETSGGVRSSFLMCAAAAAVGGAGSLLLWSRSTRAVPADVPIGGPR